MTTPRALLYGGPRNNDIVDLDAFAVDIRLPRRRDDGRLVRDVYEFSGASFDTTTPKPYVYAGEELLPEPDSSSRRKLPPGAVRTAAVRLATLLAIGVLISVAGWFAATGFHMDFAGWDF